MVKLTYRLVIFTATTVMLIITNILSIPLPLLIREDTRGFYDVINKLPAGSKVLIQEDHGMVPFGTMNPADEAIYRHIIMKNLKFVVVNFWEVQHIVQVFINPGYVKKILDQYGYQYGVDYAILGYIPGWETGMAAFARDIPSLTSNDFFGTPIGNLPVMSGIKSAAAFDLVWVSSSYVATAEGAVRQFGIPYNKPVVASGVRGLDAIWAPWYPTIVKGMAIGTRGGAEYEMLIGIYGGAATARQTSITVVMVIAFLCLVAGNARYFLVERKKVAVERKVK